MGKKSLIVIIVFYSLLSASCIQPVVDMFGGVSGVVKDSGTGETMKGVNVVISPGGTSQITGSDGTFSFEELDPTEYTMSFKKNGYSDEIQKVSVKAGLVSSVHVSMSELMPKLKVTPDALDFGLNVSTLAIDIINVGKGNLEWEISEGAEWLTCSKTKGVTEEQPTSVVVNVSRDVLESGNHSESLVIASNGGSAVIEVKVEVKEKHLPLVSVEKADKVTYDSALLYGSVVSVGSSDIIRHGFCYDMTPQFDSSFKTMDLGSCSAPYSFQVRITELMPDTKYYYRSFAENLDGLSYSNEILEFTTSSMPSLPEVETGTVTDISSNSASISGDLISLGNVPSVKNYGHIWRAGEIPDLNDYDGIADQGESNELKEFTSMMTSLTHGTEYYVRAYAVNQIGTSYGDVVRFTTEAIELPIVTTGVLSYVNEESIHVYSSAEGEDISGFGYVYSTSPSPTIENAEVIDADGSPESFHAIIHGLKANTTYYIRAYATNVAGVAYGEELEAVTTKYAPIISLSIYDIDKTSATFNCSLSASNEHVITEAGFCWSATQSIPEISNSSSVVGSEYGTQAWQSYVNNLSEDTEYYVRAYVRNSEGVVYYSDVRSFTTLSSLNNHTTGLLAYYTFENTTANDIGSSYDGTGNNVSYVSGVNGTKALKFNSESSNFTVSSPMIDDDEYSISFWVKGMYNGHIYSVKSTHSTFEYTQILSMYKNQLKYMRWMTYPDYYNSLRGFTHNEIDDSSWHMVTFISEKTTNKNILRLSLYIDGELADIINHNYDDGVMNTGVRFMFGGAIDTNGLTDLNGVMMTIDNLRVYTNVLSADAVKQIYEYEK